MYPARGGQVYGLPITLAWWQLLALCWMVDNWLPVQLLLAGYFKDYPRDPPWTHEKIFRNRKPIVPLLYQLWPRMPRDARKSRNPFTGDHWKPFMMGQSISHPHALSHRLGCCPSGAETLASLVRIWGSSHFCLAWIASHFICLFPKER